MHIQIMLDIFVLIYVKTGILKFLSFPLDKGGFVPVQPLMKDQGGEKEGKGQDWKDNGRNTVEKYVGEIRWRQWEKYGGEMSRQTNMRTAESARVAGIIE